MLQRLLIALGIAFTLALAGCAPPSGDATTDDTEESADAGSAEKVVAEPAPAPAPKPNTHVHAPQPRASAPPPPPPQVCNECGTIASIEPVKEKGTGSGMGAVVGAIAGGVIGHQFGGGKGKDVATAAGVIAGGAAGHEVEKRARGTTYYAVGVNMETGGYRTVNIADASALSIGSRVRVVGENIQLR